MILGRQPEQAELGELVARLRTGEGGTVVLAGDPGIGKTTLLEWVARTSAGVRLLKAGGRESEADLPFVALADLLRPLEPLIESLPAPLAQALSSALLLTEPTSGDRLAINAAAVHLLSLATQTQPLLLLIDDYHWLDSASRDVIDFVARRTESLGFGLIVASRNEAPSEHGGKLISLEPLPTPAATELIRSRGEVTPESERRLVELAAGNPLALVELPLDLQAIDRPASLSAALERAFRSHLDRLSDVSRQGVLCAAVEGTGAVAPVLAALRSLDLEPAGLTEAVDAGLLTIEGSELRFRHPLVRSVAHQTARPEEVRRMHVALAETLIDEDQAAWHRAMAATGPDEDVAVGLETSGRRALEKGAAGSAAAAFSKAAALTVEPVARIHRLEAAARAAHRAGNMSMSASLIDQVHALTGSVPLSPVMFLLEADIRMRRGDVASASAILRREAARIADRDPDRAATMLLVAAKQRVYRFEASAALAEVQTALDLIPEREHDVVHLTAMAMAATIAGDPGARDVTLRSMEAAMATPHGHTHTLGIGWPLVWLEEYDLARSFIARSVAIQREGGFLSYLPQALLAMAELDFRTGSWDQSRTNGQEALRLFEESQQPTEAAMASSFLARLEAVCGEEESARAHASAALNSDARYGLRAATAYSGSALGLLEMGRSTYPEAIERFEQASAICNVGGIGEPWLLSLESDLAEALIRNGDPVRALEVAEALVKAARAAGKRSALAAGLRATGLALPDNSFDEAFEEAIALHQQLPTPFEHARTLLCYGERLRRTKARVEARRHLRQALTVFETLGAEPWAARARAELAASGETLERSPSHARLTPQERQVAAIVAGGATNREAAATLFVNAKTIEFHLGNIYRKLGVRSRTELANVFRH